ncbi:shq1-like protein [Nannochloropsis gaditana CCMP526]|uniref:shq1-like protein n=1 Tax=Nannochloropsis gaditana (strain CCMP526) TaxID=1093141 RepID=UPI00029F6D7C|nr:shq1-like protein [Nannochloropsis gaditana CCMP526]EKU23078.1 shq1-like protein [Nannochloropsis gaditana CCMP526]|eukprot:XP_005852755.1 shq1-like protein [Nannochloropsis gaditana CCMP526]
MLVPRFSLQQTPNTVIVTRKSLRPYLLKLQFPHALKNNEDEESHCRAVYDANLDHGTMTVHLTKEEPGRVFEDLDLKTTLLQPTRSFCAPSTPISTVAKGRGSTTAPCPGPPTIEVLRSQDFPTGSTSDTESPLPSSCPSLATAQAGGTPDGEEGEIFHAAGKGEEGSGLLGRTQYGFNRQYQGVFGDLGGETVVLEVLRLRDPERTPEGARGAMREADEAEDFDEDRPGL